jgi:riboflavin synthase
VFSGIIRGIGTVLAVRDQSGDRSLTIDISDAAVDRPEPGASICVSGACLTATRCSEDRFEVDVSAETLSVTTLGEWTEGTRVNLEPALRVGDTLDGHWVTGHVDGVGRVLELTESARSIVLGIEAPTALSRFIARKGSIAVDGVSLTVNDVEDAVFHLNIVPYTRENTIFDDFHLGATVNIEVDIVARYLERLVPERSPAHGLNLEKLREYGFVNGK